MKAPEFKVKITRIKPKYQRFDSPEICISVTHNGYQYSGISSLTIEETEELVEKIQSAIKRIKHHE